MRNTVAIAAILLFVAAAFFVNRARHSDGHAAHLANHVSEPETCSRCREKERRLDLKTLRSTAYLESYITQIIAHGSSQHLGFKYGDMPARMADARAAPKIAAYVVTLAGRKPTHPEWVKEGRLFYISNCGGCHGEDGKGIHGTFPDLTRDPLLGIERRIRKLSVSR
ncbi:c-type cytochrome [Hydrogenimonas sp. SS33]|uniref:c-type cytochrome n=1 Tax=Hydrogenimonas leucolamina TaxID=2954236 RepID=UPI00336BBDE0